MTFSTLDTPETTSIKLDTLRKLATEFLGLVAKYRAARKETRSQYHYHSEKAAHLAQAQRDVNRVWQG